MTTQTPPSPKERYIFAYMHIAGSSSHYSLNPEWLGERSLIICKKPRVCMLRRACVYVYVTYIHGLHTPTLCLSAFGHAL
jgi:hypothetical protein